MSYLRCMAERPNKNPMQGLETYCTGMSTNH